jgi:hypothetical protein
VIPIVTMGRRAADYFRRLWSPWSRRPDFERQRSNRPAGDFRMRSFSRRRSTRGVVGRFADMAASVSRHRAAAQRRAARYGTVRRARHNGRSNAAMPKSRVIAIRRRAAAWSILLPSVHLALPSLSPIRSDYPVVIVRKRFAAGAPTDTQNACPATVTRSCGGKSRKPILITTS